MAASVGSSLGVADGRELIRPAAAPADKNRVSRRKLRRSNAMLFLVFLFLELTNPCPVIACPIAGGPPDRPGEDATPTRGTGRRVTPVDDQRVGAGSFSAMYTLKLESFC